MESVYRAEAYQRRVDAPVGDLVTTMDKLKVSEHEQSQLLDVNCVEPHEPRHRRKTIITIRKGGANDDEEGRDIGRGNGVYPDSFRRKGLLGGPSAIASGSGRLCRQTYAGRLVDRSQGHRGGGEDVHR